MSWIDFHAPTVMFPMLYHFSPEMLEIKNAVRVSDLRVILPKEIFETCFSGEGKVGSSNWCCVKSILSKFPKITLPQQIQSPRNVSAVMDSIL